LSHILDLDFLPPPQVFVQAPHGPHAPQAPSTGYHSLKRVVLLRRSHKRQNFQTTLMIGICIVFYKLCNVSKFRRDMQKMQNII
jgi:hypothetical protein